MLGNYFFLFKRTSWWNLNRSVDILLFVSLPCWVFFPHHHGLDQCPDVSLSEAGTPQQWTEDSWYHAEPSPTHACAPRKKRNSHENKCLVLRMKNLHKEQSNWEEIEVIDFLWHKKVKAMTIGKLSAYNYYRIIDFKFFRQTKFRR